jgi:AraC family transcriptional regulator of adaptative response / DNA-3-methyladenine glycosylase II
VSQASLDPVQAYVGFLVNGRFCRISCRKWERVRSDEVMYFLSRFEAEEAGYVPCAGCAAEPGEWESRLADTLRRTGEWYEQHPGEAVSVPVLADWLHVSERQLRRLFAESIGSTPKAFMAGLALARSARLLSSSDKPVLQVALESGYGTVSAFNMAFKRKFGMAPRDYRMRRRHA